jgi:methyl-accepting chemotaxis protein
VNKTKKGTTKFLPGLSLAGRLALCLVAANLVGITATTLWIERQVDGSLSQLAEEGWGRSTTELANAVAGAIKWKKPDVIAETYAFVVNEDSKPIGRALTLAQGGEVLAAFELPGTDTASIDAAAKEIVAKSPEGITSVPLDGHVLIVAPSGQTADKKPLGYLALAWRTGGLIEAVDAARWQLVATQAAATIAIVGLILLAMRAWITRPLRSITRRIDGLSAGDLETEVPGQGSNDETGVIARALESFRLTSIARLNAEQDAEEQRHLMEEERAGSEKNRALTAQQQAKVVVKVGEGLSEIARGNLTFTIGADFVEEYRKIANDYNAATARLRDTMMSIINTGEGIRSDSEEISQAATDLARRTEQQAANLEETVAALDEITTAVTQTAQGSNRARNVVAAAKTDAEKSGGVAQEAIAAMSKIEESSTQISQIIGVIDEIAFQTNLLALNAGVEAARAGEAGRGFAVVAQEVRTLAQRSAEAAKEIKTLISASTGHVERGVSMVNETGKVLKQIIIHVNDINKVVGDIASSAEEQAVGLQSINSAMNVMDQVTQENAAMVEECTASSSSLAGETDRLMQLIRRFNVGDDQNVDHDEPHPANVVELPPRKQKRAPVATEVNGSLALSASARSGQDDWTEF